MDPAMDRSPPETNTWGGALRRAAAALRPRPRRARRFGWSLLVPVVCGFAGLLFTTTATTAAGTELRNDRRPELANLIAERREQVAGAQARAADLRSQIEQITAATAGSDTDVAEQRSRAEGQLPAAGLTALRGPGLTVRLDDAPRRPDGGRPPGARADDLVVHQQDVQAVVNALWAGGAEAMTIMGVRLISTSAVRCVGNTLLLDGRVYSPPFVIAAIGEADRMRRALDDSPGVRLFRQAVADLGLGYDVRVESEITVPAYEGSLGLRSARVPS
jgi:uncharacterized protein YlxW (UPF0749 family)